MSFCLPADLGPLRICLPSSTGQSDSDGSFSLFSLTLHVILSGFLFSLQVQKESVGQKGFHRVGCEEPPQRCVGKHSAEQRRELAGPVGVPLPCCDPTGPAEGHGAHLQERKEVHHLQRGVQAAAAQKGQPLGLKLPHVRYGDPQESDISQTPRRFPDRVAQTVRGARLPSAVPSVSTRSAVQPLPQSQHRGPLAKILPHVRRFQAGPLPNPPTGKQQPLRHAQPAVLGPHAGHLRGRDGELRRKSSRRPLLVENTLELCKRYEIVLLVYKENTKRTRGNDNMHEGC